MSAYYDLNYPYHINDWNNLITAVNGRIQYPPTHTGCDGLDPLPYVTDPHRWAVSDVQEMRDKLSETCKDISFSEELDLWKPEIIDEIEAAMSQTWCDDCCDDEFKHEEDGTIIEFDDQKYTIYHGCGGPWPQPPNIPASTLTGMQVAKPGLKYRSLLIRYDPEEIYGGRTNRGINIRCDGTVGTAGSFELPGSFGHVPWCPGWDWGSCCNNQIWLDNVLYPWLEYEATIPNRVINLEIYTKQAQCCDVDE